MARAAASKAGPRLAELAGRAKCSDVGLRRFFLVLGIRVVHVGFLCVIESLDHSIESGVENDGRMSKGFELCFFGLVRSSLKQSTAMEVHGEVGIFKQVSGEDQDDAFVGFYKSSAQKFFYARQGHG